MLVLSALTLAAAAEPVGAPFGPWELAWTANTDHWNYAVAVAPTGEVLVGTPEDVLILAPADGQLLRRLDLCVPVLDGIAFLGADRLIVVCEDDAWELTWPGLQARKISSFPREIEHAAIHTDRFAVSEDDFWIDKGEPASAITYALKDGAVLDRTPLGREPEGMTFLPDGRLIYAIAGLGIQVRDVAHHTTTRAPHPTLRASGFAASPDGGRLFATVTAGAAALFGLSDGAVSGQWKADDWITRAVWVGDGVVGVSTGGLRWHAPGQPTQPAPVPELTAGLGVSADGATVCAGGQDGEVACFRRGAAPKGTLTAALPLDPVEGTFVSLSSASLVIKLPEGTPGHVGQTGVLSAQFAATDRPGFQFSGWLQTAKIRVDKIAGTTWTLAILAREGSITINGEKLEPLRDGVAVRLTLDP